MDRKLYTIEFDYINDDDVVSAINENWTEISLLKTFHSDQLECYDWGYKNFYDDSEHYFNKSDANKRILDSLEMSIESADAGIEGCLMQIEKIKKNKDQMIIRKLNLSKECAE